MATKKPKNKPEESSDDESDHDTSATSIVKNDWVKIALKKNTSQYFTIKLYNIRNIQRIRYIYGRKLPKNKHAHIYMYEVSSLSGNDPLDGWYLRDDLKIVIKHNDLMSE